MKSSLVSWFTMFAIGRTVRRLPTASRRSDEEDRHSSDFARGLRRAASCARGRIIRSECCTREIHTFWPFTDVAVAAFLAKVVSDVVSGARARLGHGPSTEGRSSPRAIAGR
jgi:hypothetical protein